MGLIRNIAYTAVVLFLGIIIGAVYGAIAAFIPGITLDMMMSEFAYVINTVLGIITVTYLHDKIK